MYPIEFVGFAVEFSTLALEFVMFAQKFHWQQQTSFSSQGGLFSPWRMPLETLEGN